MQLNGNSFNNTSASGYIADLDKSNPTSDDSAKPDHNNRFAGTPNPKSDDYLNMSNPSHEDGGCKNMKTGLKAGPISIMTTLNNMEELAR